MSSSGRIQQYLTFGLGLCLGAIALSLVLARPASGQNQSIDDPLAALFSSAVDVGEEFEEVTLETLIGEGEVPVAVVTKVQGRIDRLYRFQSFAQAQPGDVVYSSELISTYGDAIAEIEFSDGTRLSMGANSEVKLDAFVYDPETNQGALKLTVFRGMTKFVSGRMTSDSYVLQTPQGVVALRGTELVFFVEPSGLMSLGVVAGAVDFFLEPLEPSDPENTPAETLPPAAISLVGRTLDDAEVEALPNDFLSFTVTSEETVEASTSAMSDTFQGFEVVFEDPKAYSGFVSAVKTEQRREAIVQQCLTGSSCEEDITQLINELEVLGVDASDATQSLQDLSSAITAVFADANAGSLSEALSVIDRALVRVETDYVPVIKGATEDAEVDDAETTGEASADQSAGDATTTGLIEQEPTGTESGAPAAQPSSTTPLVEAAGEQALLLSGSPEEDQATFTGEVFPPASTFTVFSRRSAFSPQAAPVADSASSSFSTRNGFGITLKVFSSYYASVYNVVSENLIGTAAANWTGRDSGTTVLRSEVGFRANGGFRLQFNFPALKSETGGCAPVVVARVNNQDQFYKLNGKFKVRFDDSSRFEIDQNGVVKETISNDLPFRLTEFICVAEPSGLYAASLMLEVTKQMTVSPKVVLEMVTAEPTVNCLNEDEATHLFCIQPQTPVSIETLALELETAAEPNTN